MSQSKHAKRYSREFKEEAIRLLATSGKTAKELGRELGVTGTSLATWREQAIRHGDHPEQAQMDGVRINYSVLKLENARLKKELETLRQEREILKKSLGIRPRAQSRKGMP
jgi:transposase